MNRHIISAFVLVASTFAHPVLAQDTCGTHTVATGDTLRSIAKKAYGTAEEYRYIFEANRAKFGISPHVVRIGEILNLPCRDTFIATGPSIEPVEVVTPVAEPAPTETIAQPVVVEATSTAVVVDLKPELDPVEIEIVKEDEEASIIVTTEPAVVASLPNLKLVGFSDNQPYSDASLLHGGLITTLMETALLRSKAALVDQPAFVMRLDNDLTTAVLPENYHLSFPWLQPDCDLVEFDLDIKDLCENYTFSVPIYEAQMAMFASSNGLFKDAATEADLVGARICRPSSMHTYDLLEIGMIEPIISLETAADLAACFDKLQEDIVDIVSVNGLTADVYFADAGRNEQIIELTELVALHTIHAITPNNNEVGIIALDYLNSGLWDMLANGEWGEISKDYLLNRLE